MENITLALNFGPPNFSGSNFDIYTNSTPISPWNLPKKKEEKKTGIVDALKFMLLDPVVSGVSSFITDAIREFL